MRKLLIAAALAGAAVLASVTPASACSYEQIWLVGHADYVDGLGTATWFVNGTELGQTTIEGTTQTLYRALKMDGTTAEVDVQGLGGLAWCEIFVNTRHDGIASHYKLRSYHHIRGDRTASCTI